MNDFYSSHPEEAFGIFPDTDSLELLNTPIPAGGFQFNPNAAEARLWQSFLGSAIWSEIKRCIDFEIETADNACRTKEGTELFRAQGEIKALLKLRDLPMFALAQLKGDNIQ